MLHAQLVFSELIRVLSMSSAHATQQLENKIVDQQNVSTDVRFWNPSLHCKELDGVRGIAILMVTLYRFIREVDLEAHPLLALVRRFAPMGERGVDLFFVLSGFLITGILLKSKASDGYFRNFFVRRALRIFPLYFIALACCLWLIPRLGNFPAFEQPINEQLYLWTYLTNVRMSWLNEWCFGPLDHFWSLAVEEHFYLIWPFVVFGLSAKSLLRLSTILIVAVGLARTWAATDPSCSVAVNALTIFRLDGLCFGAVLATLFHQGLSVTTMNSVARKTLPLLIFLAFIVALLASRLLALPNSLCPALWAVLLGLLLTRPSAHWMPRIARLDFLCWLGKYSYGMYVVQLPLLAIITPVWVIDQLTGLTGNRLLASVVFVPMMFLLTMALGFTTYHLIEKHFLKLKSKWA